MSSIAVDTISPVELFSNAFKDAVVLALDSSKPLLAVVHANLRDPILITIKQRKDAELYNMPLVNRANLIKIIGHQIIENIEIELG